MHHKESQRTKLTRSVFRAIEVWRSTPPAVPGIGDPIERWLAPQSLQALHACRIRTLADLTVRIPRRKMWWSFIPAVGLIGARQIEAFFAQHAALTARTRELIPSTTRSTTRGWT